jgi:hypothetical protein
MQKRSYVVNLGSGEELVDSVISDAIIHNPGGSYPGVFLVSFSVLSVTELNNSLRTASCLVVTLMARGKLPN